MTHMSRDENFSYIIRSVKVKTQSCLWTGGWHRLVTRLAFELDKGYEDGWDTDSSTFHHYKNVEPIVNPDGSRTRYEIRLSIPLTVASPHQSDFRTQLVKYRVGEKGSVSRAYLDACATSRKDAPKALRAVGADVTDQRIELAPLDGVETHHSFLTARSIGVEKNGCTLRDVDTENLFHFLSVVSGKCCMCDIIDCFHDFDAKDGERCESERRGALDGSAHDDADVVIATTGDAPASDKGAPRPCPFCGEVPQASANGTVMHACRVLDRELRVPLVAWNQRNDDSRAQDDGSGSGSYADIMEELSRISARQSAQGKDLFEMLDAVYSLLDEIRYPKRHNRVAGEMVTKQFLTDNGRGCPTKE